MQTERNDNKMPAYQWLMRSWRLLEEVESLELSRRSVWERVTSTTASLSGDPVDGTRNPHKLDALAELDDQIESHKKEYVRIYAETELAIHLVKEWRQRRFLINRYLLYMTDKQATDFLHYSDRTIKKIKHNAYLSIDEVRKNYTLFSS